ncbi:hypothetical protein Dimus_030858 [Dionaea muscipula]
MAGIYQTAFAECKERLGFEYSNDAAAGDGYALMEAVKRGEILDRAARRGGSKRSDGHELRIFPPVLTTLNANGRPLFHLKKEIATDGRLVIHMSPIVSREIVRFVGNDGRLTMHLLESDKESDLYEEDDDDDMEAGSGCPGGDDEGDDFSRPRCGEKQLRVGFAVCA